LIVLHSSSTDVYANLAAEDLLLGRDGSPEPVLFIYRNAPAVVIGKNQNPWRECAVRRLDALGVKLARRISGGGAVYHDAGNLNVSCVLPRAAYERRDMLNLFIAALSALGVEAEIVNSTSLAVGGLKISGNAFCYRRDQVLHHGTFLMRADLDALHQALRPDFTEMETRAVASVPMPVMNLGERVHEDALVRELTRQLSARFGAVRDAGEDVLDASALQARAEKMRCWDWLFGATPDFTVRRDGREFVVHRGRMNGGESFEGFA
jgi:lipoate---protein ligase